jgi:hypothetical protein
MTTALEGGEGSASRHGRSLRPEKTKYTLYRRLGGPQGRSGQMRKISPPPGFDPRTVQPVASRYTDYATRPTNISLNTREMHSTRMVSEQHQLPHVVLTGTVPSHACSTRPCAYRRHYRCYVKPVLHTFTGQLPNASQNTSNGPSTAIIDDLF